MNNMTVYAGSLNFKMAVLLKFEEMAATAVYLNCNRAVYLNFKYGGFV
jgi:hypothetical protein